MHAHILYVVKIMWNHSFNHAAKASQHSFIHFTPKKRTKKEKKKREMDISLFLVLEGDGERWEPLQDWSHYQFQKPGFPCLKMRKGGGEIRKHWQLNAWHKDLHRMGQLLSVSGYYCQNGQESNELHLSSLTVVL